MKNLLYILIALSLFSCKKSDQSSDLRIKTAKYYRNDSLIGQTDYTYEDGTGLLQNETTQFFITNYYSKHRYYFLNDSIQVDETTFNGTDSARNLISLYISGTEHLVSAIRIFSQPFNILTYERNYQYDGNNHLSQLNYYSAKQGFDFNYSGGNVNSYKMMFPRLVAPYGTDTTQITQTYTTKAKQVDINYEFLLNPFSLPYINAPAVNIELAGATFNTTDNLIQSSSYSTFGQTLPGDEPLTTYTYSFDNLGRVQSKNYKTESSSTPSSTIYRIDYTYQ